MHGNLFKVIHIAPYLSPLCAHTHSSQEDIEELLSSDRWLGVVLEAERKSRLRLRGTQDPLENEREGQSLLLAGTNKGHLVLVDHEAGGVRYSVKVIWGIQTHTCIIGVKCTALDCSITHFLYLTNRAIG